MDDCSGYLNKPTLYFVGPSDQSFVSGGNLYNLNLITELEYFGYIVNYVTPESFLLQIDKISGMVFIDSLCLSIVEKINTNHRKVTGITFIFLAHLLESMVLEDLRKKAEKLKVEKTLLKVFSKIIVTGTFSFKYLAKIFNPEHLFILEPTIQPVFPLNSPSLKKPNSLKVVMVANLVKNKGILEFLQELGHQLTISSNIHISIFGSPNFDTLYSELCHTQVKKSSVLSEKVKLFGSRNNKEIIITLGGYDIFVSCSQMETYGMGVAEALAQKKWVLALNRGNLKYLVREGLDGRLFDNTKLLVTHLLELSTNKKLLEKCRNFNSEFSGKTKIEFRNSLQKFINGI